MNHMEDKKITEAIFEGTNEASELKNQVWNNIQKELNLSGGQVKKMKTRKSKLSGFIKYGSIAAAVTIIIGANTEYGRAAVDKVKQMFAPNKIVKQEIEGDTSQNKFSLKEGSAKYIIYIDEEIYTMKNLNGKDRIEPKVKGQNVPEVFMEIEQIKDKKPEAVASEIEKGLKGKYKKVENKGAVKEPVNAIEVYAGDFTKWDDKVEKYFFIDNTKGGTFVVKQQYFFEASEGHGVRLDNMLKEFKIVQE